ncbi:MAG: esterase-like activity of phytase family protein [Saprospiraceae bacterium]|nr:esterase-like activity of phytase family protein [Saprospiraceae bacterium]
MKTSFTQFLICSLLILLFKIESNSQIAMLQDYQNNNSAFIGTYKGVDFREAGFSGLFPIPETNNKEFWVCSDRGVNVDCANANLAACRPTYDKMYSFPSYAPKIHRVRIQNNILEILQTITVKRPDGGPASGIINPTGLGSTAIELASIDTVQDCANFLLKTTAKDTFGIDPEGIVVDKDGNFWLCEEGGATIWKLDPNGVLLKRYTPYANLPGTQSVDVQIDTVFKYRKNNRGFEGISITPNGKIYAIIQSGIHYPTQAIGDASRVHRILEIDPVTNTQRMFAYLNDGVIGSGGNSIRLRDWKIGDMVAINDSTFLVLEAALRATTDIKRIYLININQATPVNSGLYNGLTLEGLVDSSGLANNGIKAVKKSLFMDLLANGWPAVLDKAEGLAILNDSTIAVCNDNDFGQSCPLADGLPIATNNKSHIITYGLRGANKIPNYQNPPSINISQGQTGFSTSQTPYLIPTLPNVSFTSILTAGDTATNGYKMTGIPDGTGAFDNEDGTFSLLVNHEIPSAGGVLRAHGAKGGFISKWIIDKNSLEVLNGSDLVRKVKLWNGSGYTNYNPEDTTSRKAFNRFCSADLPEVSAFYNEATGFGTEERIFINGEEAGNEGRAFAHIVTGPNAGTSYELPALGKFSWENALANPATGNKTIVIGTDDSTPGQVYIYIGNKTKNGTEVDKAGLTNGKLYGISVSGLSTETNTNIPAVNTAFGLIDLGIVSDSSGASLNTKSNNLGVTNFLRPEDGAWDPVNPNDFYFVTTNGFTSPSRLWRLHFNDINDMNSGGLISVLLVGTEGPKMMDNLTIDNSGHILIQEDPGNQTHIAKIWQYTIATGEIKEIAHHDPNRFLTGAVNFLTQDEESSGIIDVQSILGPGKFLLVDQAHYSIAGEVYEGGQILALFNGDTYNANPEIDLYGNGIKIFDGDPNPNPYNNTLFGVTNIGSTVDRTFIIQNNGVGNLNINAIHFRGINAGSFSLVFPPIFPLNLQVGGSQSFTVRFTPNTTGTHVSTIHIISNDIDEKNYDFGLQGDVLTSVTSLNDKISNIDLFPNPTFYESILTLTAASAEQIQISIVDVQGKLVLTPIEKTLNVGKNAIPLSTSKLMSGIYFIQFKSGSYSNKLKLEVMH